MIVCNSACVSFLIAADRPVIEVGARVGVHRPDWEDEVPVSAEKLESRRLWHEATVLELGGSPEFAALMWSVQHSGVHYLTRAEMVRYLDARV